MRIRGEGLGRSGLSTSRAVREGRLSHLSLRGLSLHTSTELGHLLAAIAQANVRWELISSRAFRFPPHFNKIERQRI